jgi:hypothetical protein
MRTVLLLITIFLVCTRTYCQNRANVVPSDTTDATEIINDIPVNNFSFNFSTMPGQPMLNGSMNNAFGDHGLRYNDVKGSPYLNPEFTPGTVVLLNGKQFDNASLQVDLYSKNIIAEDENGKHIALNKALYNSFIITHEGEQLLYKKVNIEEPQEFFIVLFENEDFILFKDLYVTFREGVNKGLTTVEPKFIKRNDYYLVKKASDYISKIKLKENDLQNKLPRSISKAFVSHVKKKKLAFKKEKDVVQALEAITK